MAEDSTQDIQQVDDDEVLFRRVIQGWIQKKEDGTLKLSSASYYQRTGDISVEYYNVSRTHMSLEKDSPVHRPTQTNGKIISKPILGGLHHVYNRVA